VIKLELPAFVELAVTELLPTSAATAGDATIHATLETSATITVPPHTKVGEINRVDPRTGCLNDPSP